MKNLVKSISALMCGICIVSATGSFICVAHADCSPEDVYDEVLFELIEETLDENYDEGTINITAKKEIIYDLNLQSLGYTYFLNVNGTEGYAMVVNENGSPEVTELFYNSSNPYTNVAESKIYILPFTYAYFYDGCYYNTENNTEISEKEIDVFSEIAYCSYGYVVSSSQETVTYVSKTEDKYNIVSRHPANISPDGYENSCAPVAGTNIIHFYDRYCEDLIQDYTPGSSVGSSYLYKLASDETDAVTIQLYSDMGTDPSSGTTLSQFKNGLNTYCNRYGYSVTYNSCKVSGSFNFSTMQSYIESGLPIALFLSSFTISEVVSGDNSDTIYYYTYAANHVMVSFGYKTITYTLSSGTRTDNFIKVATGMDDRASGYYSFSKNTTILYAYAIDIK